MAIDDGTQLLRDCMAASYRPWHLLGPPDGGRRLGEPVVKTPSSKRSSVPSMKQDRPGRVFRATHAARADVSGSQKLAGERDKTLRPAPEAPARWLALLLSLPASPLRVPPWLLTTRRRASRLRRHRRGAQRRYATCAIRPGRRVSQCVSDEIRVPLARIRRSRDAGHGGADTIVDTRPHRVR